MGWDSDPWENGRKKEFPSIRVVYTFYLVGRVTEYRTRSKEVKRVPWDPQMYVCLYDLSIEGLWGNYPVKQGKRERGTLKKKSFL